MESQIHQLDAPFPFEDLSLTNPRQGSGADVFVSEFRMKSLLSPNVYFQAPSCSVEKDVAFTGRKQSCDLLFGSFEDTFIHFISEVFSWTVQFIISNKDQWFVDSDGLTKEYIEERFAYPLKPVKGNKLKARASFAKPDLVIYSQSGEPITSSACFKQGERLLPILRLRGVRCIGTNFSLDLDIMQAMVIEPLFAKCLILPQPPADAQAQHKAAVGFEEPAEDVEVETVCSDMSSDTFDDYHLADPRAATLPAPAPNSEPQSPPPAQLNALLAICDSPPPPDAPPDSPPEPAGGGSAPDTVLEAVDIFCEPEEEAPRAPDPPAARQEGPMDGLRGGDAYRKLMEVFVPDGMETVDLEAVAATDPKNLYREARERAKRARDQAMALHLESKRVKNQFAIQNDSDEEDDF